jgi:hypothetical protein
MDAARGARPSSGMASGEVLGTPTLFIDGEVYRGSYAAVDLVDALG